MCTTDWMGETQQSFKLCVLHPTRSFVRFFFLSHFYLPASGQAVVSGVLPSPRFVPPVFIAHKVQHPHCSSTFVEVLKSRFRALCESICAQEKVTTNLYEYALGGPRTHHIDL